MGWWWLDIKPDQIVWLNDQIINGVGYNDETRVLRVRWKKDGAIYSMLDVPREHFVQLLRSTSVNCGAGRYYRDNIRGRYLGYRENGDE